MIRKCVLKTLAFGAIFLPTLASASVSISEVAWMGTKESSTHEWFELYNSGSSEVPLMGWRLETVTGGLSISLKGSIGANGYFLVERSSDESVPNVIADLVASFGSGLRNGGDTLRLVDASGAKQDEVTGGEDWKLIGGNNETKDTAQRTGGGWATSKPTPRAGGSGQAALSAQESVPARAQVSGSTGSSVNTAPASVSTGISISGPSEVFVRNSSAYSVSIKGVSKYVNPNNISWSFGDGTTARGSDVVHSYALSGSVTIVASVQIDGIEYSSEKHVVVKNADVKISDSRDGADGYTKLSSGQKIDIGGWSLRDGPVAFVFPAHTIINAEAVSFPNSVTGMFVHNTPALFDGSGRLIAVFGDDIESSSDIKSERSARVPAASEVARAHQAPMPKSAAASVATGGGAMMLSEEERKSLIGHVGGADAMPYYFGLFAIIIAAAMVAYYASRRLDPEARAEDEAKKYTIIEMDSNLD